MRVEYYKAHGVTLEVTPWRVEDGFVDCWVYRRGDCHHAGVRVGNLRRHYTVITETEAEQRVARQGHTLYYQRPENIAA